MSERVIGKKSAQQMRAEVDAWQAAIEEVNHTYPIGEGKYETTANLAKRLNITHPKAREYIRKLVAANRAKLVGYNPGALSGGGRSAVYELTEKK